MFAIVYVLIATEWVLLWASAVLSAIVDNIPYVAALSPVAAEVSAATPLPSGPRPTW